MCVFVKLLLFCLKKGGKSLYPLATGFARRYALVIYQFKLVK